MEIDKYIKKTSIMDIYITDNICDIIDNKKEVEFIKTNIYLLGLNNKNGINSFNVLINNKKYEFIKDIIKHDKTTLKICNNYECNLFQSLLFYDEMHDTIINILSDTNNDTIFLTKIILKQNKDNHNFIDVCVELLNSEKNIIKLINIIKKIYNFKKDNIFNIIIKLCKNITEDKKLLTILEKLNIKNIDIYSDKYYNTCIDYLIEKKLFVSLEYLVQKVKYIYFENYDNNSLYNLIDKYPNMTNIILSIMDKCDINLLKNKKDENIMYKLIHTYDINEKVIKEHIDKFDIFEQNVNGDNLYNLLLNKYQKNIKNILTKKYNINSMIQFTNPYNIEINVIDNKFDIKNILIKTNDGTFFSNTTHYIMYLLIFFKKYDFDIPYLLDSSEKKFIEQSNNDINMLILQREYYLNFNIIYPHLIIWKNINNYFIHSKLIELINNSNKRYIYVKLTILIAIKNNNHVRHANIILIDKTNKIVERFEPYGNLSNTFNIKLNNILKIKICDILNYKFIYCNPYVGLQTLSDENNEFNKTIGDPGGYCLAWCMLYLELKLKYNYDCHKTISILKSYIINNFINDFNIKDKSNIYMIFIRYYSKYLDTNKNIMIKKCGIDSENIYYANLKNNDYKKIITCLNDKLNKYLNK